MVCKKCGAELPYNSKVCKVCGTVISAGNGFETQTERFNRIVNEVQSSKSENEPLNKLLEDLLAEVKEKPEAYATYKPQSQSGTTNQPLRQQTASPLTQQSKATSPLRQQTASPLTQQSKATSPLRQQTASPLTQQAKATSPLRQQTASPLTQQAKATSYSRPQATTQSRQTGDVRTVYKSGYQSARTNPPIRQTPASKPDSYGFKNQEQDEWLDPEAVREIWGTNNTNARPTRYEQQDDMLPDGSPDWLNEIRAEEQEEEKPRFSLANHPLIAGTIMTLAVVVISAISIVVIWNV